VIRSKVVSITTAAPRALQLGGARGFCLSKAPGDANATFPVTVRYTTERGDLELQAREGKVYRLSEAVHVAHAQCPTADHSYLLDLLDTDRDSIE